jgi:Ca2+-binding EF-hand superfamily protein
MLKETKMKTIPLLIAAIALGTAAYAGQGQPGAHFVENWDFNEDGQVSRAEATERRGDIFTTFDDNDDNILTAAEYVAFDEARDADHEGLEQGNGNGQGKGQGGGEYGRGEGMMLEFNDINGDGQVTRDEFMARTADWFARMDRNGDGAITTGDFGRGSN